MDARWRRRPRRRGGARRALLWLLALALLAAGGCAVRRVLSLAAELAVNYASDTVQAKVNRTVQTVMEDMDEGDYYRYQTDADGQITALSVNVERVSAVSTRILQAAMETDDESEFLELEVPLEALFGLHLTRTRLPLPVRVMMLTTSHVEYHNELVSAAINQSKYQLYLHIYVDIAVLVPWERCTAEVDFDVLLAETVIVGDVPQTYIETG